MMYMLRKPGQGEITAMRDAFCKEANCQIVRYSYLDRGFAYPMIVEEGGKVVAYGAIGVTGDESTLVEFYAQGRKATDFDELAKFFLQVTRVPMIEAQTNMPSMLALAERFGADIVLGPTLFENGSEAGLVNPGALFRPYQATDVIFPHNLEPVGDWVIESEGVIVATGGFFTHYNPPFADLYMEVMPAARRKGYGSYLLESLRRVCLDLGLMPAARCDHDNEASRRCLVRSGMQVCGHLVQARTMLDYEPIGD